MQKSVFSDNFNYSDVDLMVECDGSYKECKDKGGIGWVLVDYESRDIVAEGTRSLQNAGSTTEIEIKAVKNGIREAQEVGCESVVVVTDLDAVVENINDKGNGSGSLSSDLDELNSWMVKSVERDKISRAHDLANYSAH